MADVAFEPITPNLGAYVRVSTDEVLEDGIPDRILDALNQYGVLVFPKIHIDDDTFVALTRALGEHEVPTVTADDSEASKKGIYRIALDKNNLRQLEYVKGNDYWHMDGTSYDIPGKATLLKCIEPPSSGGETEFAHLFAAYEALPEAKKQQLEGLQVIHCMEAVGRRFTPNPTEEDLERWNRIFPPTEHPLVWKQSTGRTSLVIGATAKGIAGMSEEEGKALLQELLDWCTGSDFTYCHKWQEGDLVIWNNPGLLHRSHPYTEESGRVMHRTTIKGTEAFAA